MLVVVQRVRDIPGPSVVLCTSIGRAVENGARGVGAILFDRQLIEGLHEAGDGLRIGRGGERYRSDASDATSGGRPMNRFLRMVSIETSWRRKRE